MSGWNSDALKIAHRELNNARDYIETVEGLLEDAMQQVEDADREADPHEVLYIRFTADGKSLAHWSRHPFEGGRKCRISLTEQSPPDPEMVEV